MPNERAIIATFGNGWDAISALVAADGTSTHRLSQRLLSGVPLMRDLADLVHHIGILHGLHPGVADLAAAHGHSALTEHWFDQVNHQFADERTYLVNLISAVGPLPSTPGQAESESAVTGQQHALEMLGRSDRNGCAIGASVALVIDWPTIRRHLDATAGRVGVTPPALDLPERYETAEMVSVIASQTPVERALLFGAQQLLAQHRGLFDLLEARADARHHN